MSIPTCCRTVMITVPLLATLLASGCFLTTRAYVRMVSHDRARVTATGVRPVVTLRNDGPQAIGLRFEDDAGKEQQRSLNPGDVTVVEADGPLEIEFLTGPGMGADILVKADKARAVLVDRRPPSSF